MQAGETYVRSKAKFSRWNICNRVLQPDLGRKNKNVSTSSSADILQSARISVWLTQMTSDLLYLRDCRRCFGDKTEARRWKAVRESLKMQHFPTQMVIQHNDPRLEISLFEENVWNCFNRRVSTDVFICGSDSCTNDNLSLCPSSQEDHSSLCCARKENCGWFPLTTLDGSFDSHGHQTWTSIPDPFVDFVCARIMITILGIALIRVADAKVFWTNKILWVIVLANC